MAYKYKGTDTIATAEQRREQLEAELRRAREEYKTAQKLARENERLEAQILRTKQRTIQLAKPLPAMPEPIHGGREGLLAATREAEGHDPKRATKRAAA